MPRVVALSSTSVTLEWEPPPSEHQNGIIRFYSVCYLEEETTLEFLSTSNSTTLTIMDLHPHFTYYIRVRAETVSPGPFSGLQRVQLEEDGNDYLCIIIQVGIYSILFSLQLRRAVSEMFL